MDKKIKLSTKHCFGECGYFRHMFFFVMITIWLISLSLVVSAEDSEGVSLSNNIQILIGVILGGLIILTIRYIFYKKGLLSFFTVKKIDGNEGQRMFVESIKSVKKSFIAYSGEFPSSVWNDVAEDIVNFANQRGTENVKLIAGQVVCIGSLKNKKDGKEFYSQFLKAMINARMPLRKKRGNTILNHEGECHFRIVDDANSFFHYHHDDKIYTMYDTNNYSLGNRFKEKFTGYLKKTEEFNLKKAEKENALVIELENIDEKGLRYRYATKDEINDFKLYLNT